MADREMRSHLETSGTSESPTARNTGVEAFSSPPSAASPDQGELFDGAELGIRPSPQAGVGFRGPVAMKAAGITYRQLDYWARTSLVVPSVRAAAGSGSARLYSFRDILVLRLVKKLLDSGVSLQNVRSAIEELHNTSETADLSGVTLLSDGATVYHCTSENEVIDLLAGGQGVFGIAVGPVAREVEGQLAELPGERPDGAADEAVESGEAGRSAADELAARRRRRTSA
jgi:DNA-binding transcriptional MerR regulator